MVQLSTLVTLSGVEWGALCMWLGPAVLLVPLWLRSPRDERRTWSLVALILALIWADKTMDLQSLAHNFGQELVQAVDPEWRMRGPHLWMRWTLVGSACLAVLAGFSLLLRRDPHIGIAKVLTLVGLAGVAGFVIVRHLPALRDPIAAGLDRWIEWTCLGLVLAGLTHGLLATRGLSRGDAT